jgi:hypothetical protein
VDRALEDYIAVLQNCGFPPKWTKVHWASTKGISLGVEIDGLKGTVSLAPDKMVSLISDTLRTLRQDAASAHDMQVLLGRWVWAMLPRREALSVFQASYAFAATGAPSSRLWSKVAAELKAAVGLAPLLVANLRSPWAPWALASDASLYAQGVTYTDVAPETAARLSASARVSAKASLPVNERRTPIGPRPVLGGARQPAPGVRDFVRRARWRTCVSSLWKYPGFITHLEASAACTALRWNLSRPSGRAARVLHLVDNAAVEAAIRKGRCSAYALLLRQRRIAALLLASGTSLHPVWIPSAINPADEPSRPPTQARFL